MAASPDGTDHWPAVATRVIDMWRTQPTLDAGNLAAVRAPTLVMAGDDDLMTLEHTAALPRRTTPGRPPSRARPVRRRRRSPPGSTG
ncbi:hypothetical protein [Streptomyces albogriseolus]|uniref:hypothetical protein n=1 Tax=Streptomyces albogriseolus TaxID=1887 RepID=UPI0033A4FB5B